MKKLEKCSIGVDKDVVIGLLIALYVKNVKIKVVNDSFLILNFISQEAIFKVSFSYFILIKLIRK
jgi:hypothetical protein